MHNHKPKRKTKVFYIYASQTQFSGLTKSRASSIKPIHFETHPLQILKELSPSSGGQYFDQYSLFKEFIQNTSKKTQV
jgi:hypothetical protein